VHLGRFVERRRAEDLTLALASARRDFDRVIGQLNDYIWTVEIRPDGRVHSVYASPNGLGVFGGPLPTGGDLNVTGRELVHPDDRPAFVAFHQALAAGEDSELECRFAGFDGVTRWVWTGATARREGGRLYVDGISTNVTDRREVAEARSGWWPAAGTTRRSSRSATPASASRPSSTRVSSAGSSGPATRPGTASRAPASASR
jgi:hypothetical protein